MTEIINSSTEILGKQLYMILHDPNGDNSFSSFLEESSISMGVGSEIIPAVGTSLELGISFDLFGASIGSSYLLEERSTTEEGFDFRYEISDSTSLTSNKVSDNPDYIGPGYGDTYWGESWIYKWVLNATRRVYSNGTDRWEMPQLFYGILRDVETFVSDKDAPPEWRIQNVIYNNFTNVDWIKTFAESGGFPYTFDHAVESTETRKVTFSIDLGSTWEGTIGGVERVITIELSKKNHREQELTNLYRVSYEIYDDDPDDFLAMNIGIDRRFGTYIFNTSSFFCETSFPFEHNSYDYRPPDIDFPRIVLDSDNDGRAPTDIDTPIVTVGIFEEGGVQEAIVWYSTDGGTIWNLVHLIEQPANPGTWQATLPAKSVDTTVLWYIQVWDNQGNNATRKDPFNNPYEYTVIKRPEKPEILAYPLLPMFIFLTTSIIAIIIIKNTRQIRFKK